MKLNQDNLLLLLGKFDKLAKYQKHKSAKYQFSVDFGLDTLPEDQGLISIRGARQFGKSTWLENQLVKTIEEYGVGSSFYLNGDIIVDYKELISELQNLIEAFDDSNTKVKRIFIDEITSIKEWQRAVKYLVDRDELKGILVVATGSSANDLRRGAERLPGRKGKLEKTEFIFPPVSYKEFLRVYNMHGVITKSSKDLVVSYLISGGSPIGLAEIIENDKLSEDLITLTKDWIIGAISFADRSRQSLLGVINSLYRFAGTPVGYNKLAQDSGLTGMANAQGYIEVLTDCLSVASSYAWDHKKQISLRRKQAKFNFINLLVAISFSKDKIRTVEDFNNLPEEVQGKWFEWLVAQEIFRKRVITQIDLPEHFNHFAEKDKEIDFIIDENNWLEVKRGQASPHEFSFLPNNIKLKVICNNKIDLDHIKSITLEDFLLSDTLSS